jgi:hypothetical protein
MYFTDFFEGAKVHHLNRLSALNNNENRYLVPAANVWHFV